MENFTKVIRIGTTVQDRRNASLFCKIQYNDGKLSISGVEGPLSSGNALGSCGQIIMSDWDIAQFAPGWNAEKVSEFREIWNRYHLNDMKAGSPKQEEFLDSLDDDYRSAGFSSHYDWACSVLEEAGLHPDLTYMHNGSPYRYGSAWLREEVPAEVLEWLYALPDTDIVTVYLIVDLIPNVD